jgi:hypothetical protein
MIASSSIIFYQLNSRDMSNHIFLIKLYDISLQLLCMAGRKRETSLSDAYPCQIPCSYVFIESPASGL